MRNTRDGIVSHFKRFDSCFAIAAAHGSDVWPLCLRQGMQSIMPHHHKYKRCIRTCNILITALHPTSDVRSDDIKFLQSTHFFLVPRPRPRPRPLPARDLTSFTAQGRNRNWEKKQLYRPLQICTHKKKSKVMIRHDT